MKKLVLAAAAAVALSASGAETPLWLRNAAISPDGSRVAFTYKGDIYTVPTAGGHATQITTAGAYDTAPLWSPDGKRLAFASDREGSLDIFVMDADGGTPLRLTTYAGAEQPKAWLDNGTILFSCSLQPAQQAAQGDFQAQTYAVAADGKTRPVMYMSLPTSAISVNSAGDVLYQDRKGYEDPLRKHERSSGTADVWLKRGDKFSKLTSFRGVDADPVWAADGKSFYYTTEASAPDSTLNVHRRALDGSSDVQLTSFTRHPVRSLSAANDGTLAFSWNGELYTLTPGATEPNKLNVEIVTDDYTRQLIKDLRRGGASSMSVSPDGDEVAFVVRGDVYVTSTKYKTTRQITNTPEQERTVSFSPDGKTLVYDSERDGIWQLFTATVADKDQKKFAYAAEITETPLYRSAKPAFQPAFSPDGKSVAFLEDRTTLRVIDLGSKKVHTALDGRFNYSYTDGDVNFEWSPDSRWLLADYIGVGGWNNTDIALVKADGSEVHDLTESGYSDGGAKWVLDGKAMIWTTDRNGYRSHGSWGSQRDVYIMFFDADAYEEFMMNEEDRALLAEAKKKADEAKKGDDDDKDKKKKDKKKEDKKADDAVTPLVFDLDNARYRTVRLTRNSSSLGDYLLSKDGTKLYYISSFEGGGDLWKIDLQKGDVSMLHKGLGYGSMEFNKAKDKIYMVNGNSIRTIAPDNGKTESVDFEAFAEYRPFAEREYIYNHMWQQVKDKFYDENLHGVDWDFYGAEYRRFLPHITNNYDFATLLSEILGELNASHTGGRYRAPGRSFATASLGGFFDDAYTGEGIRVTEAIKGGPLFRAKVQPGDVILAIDGESIAPAQDYFPLLEGKVGRKTRLTVRRVNGTTEQVQLRPISWGENSSLLYRRWVEHNEHVVDSVSGGRVAYVHVQGMDSESFREVFSKLLGKYRNHEAVVVDTRYNGGGWLHNDIAVLLSGEEYVRFTPRGQYIGSEPFTRWTKPSVMLVNESNYSDAHGTPYTYQTLGIGDVVGAPIPGTMTAVWWETQIDPSLIFGIPQVTSRDRNGNVLENQQLNPDVVIYNDPADVLTGTDAQLIGATKHLLKGLK